MIVLENYEQKQLIENAFNSDDLYNITCVRAYSKGFFVASENGTMALWVRSDENNAATSGAGKDSQLYDFIRKWQPPATKGTRIISMCISPTEEYVAAACKNNDVALVHVKSVGLNEDQSKDVKVDLMCRGFHSGPITRMDVAVQRPLLVTCSREDSTIRIWNYLTNTCELAREYYVLDDMTIKEAVKPLLTVAMHPSGYYMAAGFTDKIRIYHILHDELREFRNLEIKNCSQMRFSHGGQWFAAAD